MIGLMWGRIRKKVLIHPTSKIQISWAIQKKRKEKPLKNILGKFTGQNEKKNF